MSAHMPGKGPWRVQNVVWLQNGTLHETYPKNDKGAEYLLNVGNDYDHVAICYGEANARLIAAAPLMKDELAAFVADAETTADYLANREYRARVKRARAILRDVEGESK